MKCKKCGSKDVFSISAKYQDDNIRVDRGNKIYIPGDIKNVIDGEFIEFDVCLNCGQIQGGWPVVFNLESVDDMIEKEGPKNCLICKKELKKGTGSRFCKDCEKQVLSNHDNLPLIDYGILGVK